MHRELSDRRAECHARRVGRRTGDYRPRKFRSAIDALIERGARHNRIEAVCKGHLVPRGCA